MTMLGTLKIAVAIVVACLVLFICGFVVAYAVLRVALRQVWSDVLAAVAHDPSASWTDRFKGWK